MNLNTCMSAVLHAQKIEGSHTGVAICQALESMLESWKIQKQDTYGCSG